jgi:hypothetical protein
MRRAVWSLTISLALAAIRYTLGVYRGIELGVTETERFYARLNICIDPAPFVEPEGA